MTKDVFSDIKAAIFRAPTNVHRIQQLSDTRNDGLNEDTVTDLLLNEMIGADYSIDASCPKCLKNECGHWSSALSSRLLKLRAKPLSRYEEGGNKRHGAEPAAADWILEITGPDGTNRMMFQAKRGGLPHTTDDKGQFKNLKKAARGYGASAFYVIYLRHDDPHRELRTKCKFRTSAADTSMLVLSAKAVDDLMKIKAPLSTLAKKARPLSCIAGCRCLGTSDNDLFDSATKFIRNLDRKYAPRKASSVPKPEGVALVAVDSSRVSLSTNKVKDARASQHGEDSVFIIRFGAPRRSDVDGSNENGELERRIGFHTDPPLSDDEWLEATRKYWRASPIRASRVNYLVASHKGKVHQMYRVIEKDGVIQDFQSGGRIEFKVDDRAVTGRLRSRIKNVAEARLEEVSGSRTPFVYADFPD